MSGPVSIAQAAEEALVERAKAGDRDAFDAIVAAHLPLVWKVVWRMVRHSEDTEDIVQEVFLTAWRSLPGWRGEASFSTWLHTIATTRALNHLSRAEERLRRASDALEVPDPEGGPPKIRREAEEASARPDSPLELLEAEELGRRLARCLERLPAAWRAVLALRDVEERSYEQIASVLSLALGTVRSRLARARVALRECVEGPA